MVSSDLGPLSKQKALLVRESEFSWRLLLWPLGPVEEGQLLLVTCLFRGGGAGKRAQGSEHPCSPAQDIPYVPGGGEKMPLAPPILASANPP